jgi:xanthine dehydrogenase small subunit
MSLTGFCVDDTPKTAEMAVSAVDGNICRCTGYKSIERAAEKVCGILSEPPASADGQVAGGFAPSYFSDIATRLTNLHSTAANETGRPLTQPVPTGGGTDLYVQRPEEMAEGGATPLLYEEELRGIRDTGEYVEIGASSTVTDLLVSPVMQSIFPGLYKHLKLISSTPIRNMATLAGNFINASPIGDMTVWFLALDAEIHIGTQAPSPASFRSDEKRTLSLKDLYLGYKELAKQPDEIITAIRFKKPTGEFRFNFEKISKRTYLDIATVNTAISMSVSDNVIADAHVAAGGVAPIPLYLKETSAFLNGRETTEETIIAANEIMQSEISPISDVRGTEQYKCLLLRQLFRAHFVEMFGV